MLRVGALGGPQPHKPAAEGGGAAGGPRSLVPSCTGTNAQGQTSPIRQGELSPPAPPNATPSAPRCARTLCSASHANQPPKIHIKGLLRATANGNVSPGTAEELKANSSDPGCAVPGGAPSAPPQDPPQPALPAVPPSRTPGPLVPSRRSVYKYRGHSARLLPPPTPSPPPSRNPPLPRGGHGGAFILPGTPGPKFGDREEEGTGSGTGIGAREGGVGVLLTLPFKFTDDGIQVGVLGGHMAPAHRHRPDALR